MAVYVCRITSVFPLLDPRPWSWTLGYGGFFRWSASTLVPSTRERLYPAADSGAVPPLCAVPLSHCPAVWRTYFPSGGGAFDWICHLMLCCALVKRWTVIAIRFYKTAQTACILYSTTLYDVWICFSHYQAAIHFHSCYQLAETWSLHEIGNPSQWTYSNLFLSLPFIIAHIHVKNPEVFWCVLLLVESSDILDSLNLDRSAVTKCCIHVLICQKIKLGRQTISKHRCCGNDFVAMALFFFNKMFTTWTFSVLDLHRRNWNFP